MRNVGSNATAAPPAHRADEAAAPRPLEVRALTYSDLPAVLSIERRSFGSPWSLAMFVLELAKPGGVCLAAVVEGRPIGYVVCSRYDRAWHLMNVAVSPEHRRLGVATTLIEEVLAEVGEALPMTLEVRPSNRSAIAMYERFGFSAGGVRRRYYDNGEDALVMWLGDPAVAGVPV